MPVLQFCLFMIRTVFEVLVFFKSVLQICTLKLLQIISVGYVYIPIFVYLSQRFGSYFTESDTVLFVVAFLVVLCVHWPSYPASV